MCNEQNPKELIEAGLKNKCKVIFLEQIDSTNDYLKNLVNHGERENTLVIADRQSKGKGRLGRKFFSPDGGLYFSLLLRPNFSPEKALLITTAAAVVVSEALSRLSGKSAGIKWVNDIFIDNKKVCGILTEASTDFKKGTLEYAVLGIGINLYSPKDGFPDDIKDIAGVVFDKEPDCFTRAKIVSEIINAFFEIYDNFEKSDFLKRYKEKLFILGKKIDVIKNNTKRCATALDIDEKAGLVVEYENGDRETLSSGEVSIRF